MVSSQIPQWIFRPVLAAPALLLLSLAGGCGRVARAPDAVADKVKLDRVSENWICGGTRLAVLFEAEHALLTLADGEHVLHATVSASGARYAEAGREGRSLWSRGPADLAFSANGLDWHTCSPAPEVFLAHGHEPHWQLRIEGQRGQLVRPGLAKPLDFELRSLGSMGVDSVISATAPEAAFEIRIRDELCRNPVGGMPHPQSVLVELPDRQLRGCAGEPIQLLTAQDWAFELDQTPYAQASLRFDANFAVHLHAPCRHHRGRFALSREALSLQWEPSTGMDCATDAAAAEQSLLEALAATVRFDLDDQGWLRLIGPRGPTLQAQPAKRE